MRELFYNLNIEDMKKFTFLALRFALAIIVTVFLFTLPSCSSTKTAMLCPDLHKHKSAALAMIKQYRSSKRAARSTNHSINETAVNTQAGNIHPIELTPVESIPLKGLASLSDDVPTFATAMEKFKNLDQDERMQAKKAIEDYLAKRPILKKMALKRFDKIDAQYPAAEKARDGGGGMGVGEILSIVAIVLAFLFPPVGLILGIVALVLINGNGGAGWARSLAIAAIIVGAILTIVGGAVIIVVR